MKSLSQPENIDHWKFLLPSIEKILLTSDVKYCESENTMFCKKSENYSFLFLVPFCCTFGYGIYKLRVFNVFWTSFVLSSKLWSGLIFRANICLFIYLSYFFGPAVSLHLTFPTVLLLTILCFIKSELISQALQPFETRCTWGRRLRFFWYSHKRLAFQISWSFTYG